MSYKRIQLPFMPILSLFLSLSHSGAAGADVIHFDGQGVISYRFKMKKMKILKDVIALKFKTGESDGVILHGEGQQGDYITLELRKGKLLLQINLGTTFHSTSLPIYKH